MLNNCIPNGYVTVSWKMAKVTVISKLNLAMALNDTRSYASLPPVVVEIVDKNIYNEIKTTEFQFDFKK